MLRRPIPSSGEEIAAVGLGTWRGFDIGTGSTERAQLRAVLDTLFDGNASVVDSSPMYGRAEGVTGDLLADMTGATTHLSPPRSGPRAAPRASAKWKTRSGY
jgi:aryl-alcohol dehydrogenase-like predicted oxidoreductase